jgi:hypothetical protein
VNAHLPAPTIWPVALAAGIALVAAGVLTHWLVSAAGALLAVIAVVGWVSLLVEDAP